MSRLGDLREQLRVMLRLEDFEVAELMSRLTVGVGLDDINNAPEEDLWRKIAPWSSGMITVGAGGAGNFSRLQITAVVGYLTIVQGFKIVGKTTTGTVILTMDAAAAATPTQCMGLDSRIPLNTTLNQISVATINLIANNNAVVSGQQIDRWSVIAGGDGVSSVLPVRPVILHATTAFAHNLTLFNQTANEALVAVAWGYQKAISVLEAAYPG